MLAGCTDAESGSKNGAGQHDGAPNGDLDHPWNRDDPEPARTNNTTASEPTRISGTSAIKITPPEAHAQAARLQLNGSHEVFVEQLGRPTRGDEESDFGALFIQETPGCRLPAAKWTYGQADLWTPIDAGTYHVIAWSGFPDGVILHFDEINDNETRPHVVGEAPVAWTRLNAQSDDADASGFEKPAQNLTLISLMFQGPLVTTGYDWSYDVSINGCTLAQDAGSRTPTGGEGPSAFRVATLENGVLEADFTGDMDWSATLRSFPNDLLPSKT